MIGPHEALPSLIGGSDVMDIKNPVTTRQARRWDSLAEILKRYEAKQVAARLIAVGQYEEENMTMCPRETGRRQRPGMAVSNLLRPLISANYMVPHQPDISLTGLATMQYKITSNKAKWLLSSHMSSISYSLRHQRLKLLWTLKRKISQWKNMDLFKFLYLISLIPSTLARIYLVVESFVGLRSAPLGAFAMVEWVNIIPYI